MRSHRWFSDGGDRPQQVQRVLVAGAHGPAREADEISEGDGDLVRLTAAAYAFGEGVPQL